MPKIRKYVKGPEIGPLEVFASVLLGKYVMQGDRPIHPGFMLSRRLSDVMHCCIRGQFFEAIPNPQHPDNLETE